jgi:UDP:flavonoid glycosyltransferase YjiC (YdhE family)
MGYPARSRPYRVLFMAEAVTLAHVARPFVLAQSLDPDEYEVIFASAPRYSALLPRPAFPTVPLHSISPEQFLDALSRGRPLHDIHSLRSYVEEDLILLRETRPDAVVGDLRHSLGVSARLARVPYVSIVNAYWSPYARQRFCVPEIPLTRLLGVPLANALFQCARPFAFAAHCAPMNRVRREHGLPPIGKDVRVLYTEADWVLYPDVREMVPTDGLPPTHRYAGPILWSPSVGRPAWWNELPPDRPIVYITLGSSGSSGLLAACLEGLADEPIALLVASVGAKIERLPRNAWVTEFLPGMESASRASLVICNGGSPTSHQALAAGTPVLGLPSNMDQHLNMSYLAATGAGETLRSESVTPASVRACVRRLLENPSYRSAAGRIRASFAAYDCSDRFRALLREICPRPASG